MNTMQQELDATYPLLRVQLLGVNDKGQEAGNASTTAGRTLPWLQDVDADGNGKADVTKELWSTTNRDVVILDGNNEKVGVYNLTTHDLADSAYYATLRQMLIDAAMTSQKPWRNPIDPLDVNNDGHVAPLDVLIIINMLNSPEGSHRLPVPTADQPPPYFYDCNGDGIVAPIDALIVINFLNARSAAQGGEGEADGTPASQPHPASYPIFALRDGAAPAFGESCDGAAEGRLSPTHEPSALSGEAEAADGEDPFNRFDGVFASEGVDWLAPDLVAAESRAPLDLLELMDGWPPNGHNVTTLDDLIA
jgi:hypothetical protein